MSPPAANHAEVALPPLPDFGWSCDGVDTVFSPRAIEVTDRVAGWSISPLGIEMPAEDARDEGISPGAVLVAETDNIPLIREVTTTYLSGDRETMFVETRQAALTDAFEHYCFQGAMETPNALSPVLAIEEFDIDHEIEAQVGEHWSLEGEFRARGVVAAGVHVAFGRFSHLSLGIVANVRAHMTPEISVHETALEFEKDITLLPEKTITPIVAPYFYGEVQVEAEAEIECAASAGLSAETTIHLDHTFSAVIDYKQSLEQLVPTIQREFILGEPQGPGGRRVWLEDTKVQLKGVAECTISLGPEFELEGYKLLELGLFAGAMAKLSAEHDLLARTCSWESKASVGVWALAELDPAGKKFDADAEVSLVEVLERDLGGDEYPCGCGCSDGPCCVGCLYTTEQQCEAHQQRCEVRGCDAGYWCDESECVPEAPASFLGRFLDHPLRDPVWVKNGWQYNKQDNSAGQNHYGIDYAREGSATLPIGTPVHAACDGVAIWASQDTGRNRGFGRFVLQRCDDRDEMGRHYFVLYAHLSGVEAHIPRRAKDDTDYSAWMPVRRGEVLGASGSDDTSWAHLHLEVFLQGYVASRNDISLRVDPYDLYKRTDATQDSRDFYPPRGARFAGCGEESLWRQCPPTFASGPTTIESISPRAIPYEQYATFEVIGSNIPPRATAYIPDCAGLKVLSRTPQKLVFACTPRWRTGVVEGGVIKDQPMGNVLHEFSIQVYTPTQEDVCDRAPGKDIVCGSSLGLKPDTLYDCARQGAPTEIMDCSATCARSAQGINDRCEGSDPSCPGSCVVGAVGCQDDRTPRECVRGPDGCGTWHEKTSCRDPELCDAGACSACIPEWSCTEWTTCTNELQTRGCQDLANCSSGSGKPETQRPCCDASKAWEPSSMSARDPEGLESSGPIAVELEAQIEAINSSERLRMRICKSSGTLQNDLSVYFENNYNFQNRVALDATLAKSGTCTDWGELQNTAVYAEGEGMGGQIRVVSPASCAPNWGRWCSPAPDPGCGTCWYINTSTLHRTCAD